MKSRKLRAVLGLPFLGGLILMSYQCPASAHLGGGSDSVTVDREVFQGQLRTTPMTQYNMHEISLASGTLVREYESRSGTVFAVTWRGPMPPNLQQLFGTYFVRFSSAAAATAARPGSHRQFSLAQSDFVVQSAGHMRAFEGRAYLPALVPAGVSIVDLQ